eukprot:g12381.t1
MQSSLTAANLTPLGVYQPGMEFPPALAYGLNDQMIFPPPGLDWSDQSRSTSKSFSEAGMMNENLVDGKEMAEMFARQTSCW